MRLLVYLLFALPALADWTQWGGPQRNFTATTTGLATSWSWMNGPPKFWSRTLGDGYSAIVTDGLTLYTMFRRGQQEVTTALDASSGKTIWEHAQEAPFRSGMGMEYGSGPHATPLIAGERLFSVGILAKLHAYDRKSGKALWSHDLYEEFQGDFAGRGFAVSPVAYKDTVIMKIGGPSAGVIAFRQSDGAVVWKKGAFDNAPATPLLIRLDGQDQLVLMTAAGVMGVDPSNGAELWRHGHPTQWGLNTSTPVWGPDNLLFVSSAYDGGSRVLKLARTGGKTSVEELWFHKRMRIHFTNAMRIGDYVYGSSGDFGPSPMTCVEVKTGKVVWQDRAFAKASFVYADGKLILLDEDGTLAVVTVGPEGMKTLAKHSLLDKAWTVPTLDGKRLYLRDKKSIMAVSLGQ